MYLLKISGLLFLLMLYLAEPLADTVTAKSAVTLVRATTALQNQRYKGATKAALIDILVSVQYSTRKHLAFN